MTVVENKMLLVLDVNGLLLDTYSHAEKCPEGHPPDAKVGKYRVYKRPFCEEFLEFCFKNFAVGIWSSARQYNVDILVDFIFGNLKRKLLFSWNQSDCTDTGLKTRENKFKPLFLKELSKLWNKVKPGLPWKDGEYGPFNTLLIDDTPYKALRNPPNTAIFPYPYKVGGDPGNILGGALRTYLQGLLTATNVQCYVENHPFGQLAITPKNGHWDFYKKVLVTEEPAKISKTKRKRLSSTESVIKTLEILQVTDIHLHSVAGVGAKSNDVSDMVAACSAGTKGEKDNLENKKGHLLDDNRVKDLQLGPHDQSLISNSKCKRKNRKKHTYHQDGHMKDTGGKHSSSSEYVERDLLKETNAQFVHVQWRKCKSEKDILENKEVNLMDDNCVQDLQPGLHDQSLISNLKRKGNHKTRHTYQQDGHIKDARGKRSRSSQFVERDLLKEKNAESVHVQWREHKSEKDILENKEANLLGSNCKGLQVGLHDQPLISKLKRKENHKMKQTYHQDGRMRDAWGKRSCTSQCVERDLLKEQNAQSVHVQSRRHTTDTVDKHPMQNTRRLEKHHRDNFYPRQLGRGNYLQRGLPVDLQNCHYGSNQASEVCRGFQAHNYFLNENIARLPVIWFPRRPLVSTVEQNLWTNASYNGHNGQYQAHVQRHNHALMQDSSQPQIIYNKRKNFSGGHFQNYHNHSRRKRFEQR